MRIRSLAVLSTVVATTLLLASCAGSDEPVSPDPSAPAADTGLCEMAAEPGAASDSATIDGVAGEVSTAEFETGQTVEELERTVVSEGDGPQIETGDYVEYALSAFDIETGERLGDAGYEAGELLPATLSADPGLSQVLGCATIGTRLSVAFPGTAEAGPQLYIVDVLGITPLAAWGEEQDPVPGMPGVTLADDGVPTVVIPDAAAPEELQIAVLKEGDGPEVATGDTTLVQYYGVDWETGETFDDSWSSGAPMVQPGNPYVAGFVAALEGQPVGSQVLVTMPPSLAYGEEGDAPEGQEEHPLAGQTLVFVIDILATQHPVLQ